MCLKPNSMFAFYWAPKGTKKYISKLLPSLAILQMGNYIVIGGHQRVAINMLGFETTFECKLAFYFRFPIRYHTYSVYTTVSAAMMPFQADE